MYCDECKRDVSNHAINCSRHMAELRGVSFVDDWPTRYLGVPVIREGDNVFIINTSCGGFMRDVVEDMREMVERSALRFAEYDCPFDFLLEYDKWFEWKKREHFDRDSTGQIMCDMVQDVERIKAHTRAPEFKFRAHFNDAPLNSHQGALLASSTGF